MNPSPQIAGILCLVAGVAVFSLQDVIIKLLSGSYPLHQVMVFRSVTAVPVLALLVMLDGGLRTLVTPGLGRMLARAFILFWAYFAYYLALAALPLATTVALYFSAPLFITILSVLFLGERAGPRRWLAVAAGFAGVLVILRPGGALFDWAAVLALASGLAYAGGMILARRLGPTETAAALSFWSNAVFLTMALALALAFGGGDFAATGHPSLEFLVRGWVRPTAGDALLMAATGLIAAIGIVLLTQAYRIAEASLVAPFEYTAMIWGVLYGWIFWRDWPDATAWTGIAIIVAAGLYVLYREAVAKARGAAAGPAPGGVTSRPAPRRPSEASPGSPPSR